MPQAHIVGPTPDGNLRFVLPTQEAEIELTPNQAERLGGTLVDAAIEARRSRPST